MKKLFSLIGIIVLNSSCQTEIKKDTLLQIDRGNKLELITVDDKCGEWGGNEKKLIIYRDDFDSQLLADYSEKTKMCENNESKVSESIKRIKINEEESNLILECMNELYICKMRRKVGPSHSGIYNFIWLSDSSLFISDFPSVELKKFNELVVKIKQK